MRFRAEEMRRTSARIIDPLDPEKQFGQVVPVFENDEEENAQQYAEDTDERTTLRRIGHIRNLRPLL